ncbi:MAG TPA: CBS domain-containing protein [Firmicutes bacterium]|nr:CBS domain-containing protein [Candidatus Fermentithermobacillaceae bacterium]
MKEFSSTYSNMDEALGGDAMFVRDVMTRNPASIHPDATLRELLALMTEKTFEAIPVRSNGKVTGIVTDWDIVTNTPKSGESDYLDTVKVKDIMTANVMTVSENEVIEMAAYHMYFHDLDALPVVDEAGNLIAIVTQNDVFRTLVSLMGLRAKGTRLTIEIPDRAGVLAEITGIVRDFGISIASLSTNLHPGAPTGLVILRVKSGDVDGLVKAISAKYKVIHVSKTWE